MWVCELWQAQETVDDLKTKSDSQFFLSLPGEAKTIVNLIMSAEDNRLQTS